MKEREQNKDYVISIAENRNYIIIKYLVPMSTQVALTSGPELKQLSDENNIKRFLFDMRESPNIQSVTNNYLFAYQKIQTFDFPRNSLSAFLIKPLDHSHDFITTAFENAGYSVAKFVSENEAIEWLNTHLEQKS